MIHAIFVCVPTPPNEDGSVNVDTVKEVLSELNNENYKGVVVLKSTIIPGLFTRT